MEELRPWQTKVGLIRRTLQVTKLVNLNACTCPVWPDVGVKSSPNFSKSYPRSSHNSFYVRVRFFKIAQNDANNLGYFCEKFCHQKLSKIAQSGHTGAHAPIGTKIKFGNLLAIEGRATDSVLCLPRSWFTKRFVEWVIMPLKHISIEWGRLGGGTRLMEEQIEIKKIKV